MTMKMMLMMVRYDANQGDHQKNGVDDLHRRTTFFKVNQNQIKCIEIKLK